MGTIGNAKRQLIDHQQQHVGILDNLADLIPLEVVVLHAGLVAADSVDGLDSLLFIEEACFIGRVGKEEKKDDCPDEGDETKDNEEPLQIER